MNKYLKSFIHRGLIFSGLGPVTLGIVLAIISACTEGGILLSGGEILLGIASTYLLAFVQAGASVFNQIEEWPIAKSLFVHLTTLYLTYLLVYLLNSWIPFDITVVLIFTATFAVIYLAIWLTVFVCVRAASRKMTDRLA